MMTLPDAHLVELLSQHALQSEDLLLICNLADVEGIVESVQSWSFDQFMGFSVHLFMTTEEPSTRAKLARVMPKFGSAVVRSLLKIAYHPEMSGERQQLAEQSLTQIAPYSLTYGLVQVLISDEGEAFRPLIVQTLAKLVHTCDESILLLLSQLLPQRTWERLERQLIQQLPVKADIRPAYLELLLNEPLVAAERQVA